MNRVVITGLGSVTGFGYGWQIMWESMLAGHCCIREWKPDEIKDDSFPVKYAAYVDNLNIPVEIRKHKAWKSNLEKRAIYGWIAASLAIEDSGISDKLLKSSTVITASGAPHHFLEDMLLCVPENDEIDPSWTELFNNRMRLRPDGAIRQRNDALVNAIANDINTAGAAINVSSACAGAAQAIGNAFHMIRRGETTTAIAGGADSVLNISTMTSLYLLGAASSEQKYGNKLCRPFDINRSGLVAGEGGGFLILESLEQALLRNAKIYAEIVGYGSSLDGYRVTAPDPKGTGAIRSMQRALKDAELLPQQVDLINSHGTSTPLNDTAETLAIKHVFAVNEHYKKITVTANKSQFGHLIAAAAAPELIVTALSCKYNKVTPTINIDIKDPQCDLDYCDNNTKDKTVNFALSNSFGFGGLNTSLIIKKYDEGNYQ